MWRIIIILVLLIILFFMVRTSIRDFFGKKKPPPSLPRKDVMVQDPVCKAYIPTSSARRENIGGQEYSFCCEECAGKFKNYMSG